MIVGGWHWPKHFYDRLARQKRADGWDYYFYVVSHRHPHHSTTGSLIKSHSHQHIVTDRIAGLARYDYILYSVYANYDQLALDDWEIVCAPNTIGDLEFFNQWLTLYDYSKYDAFLFAHDDAYIMSEYLISDVLNGEACMYSKCQDGIRLSRRFSTNVSDWHWISNSHFPSYYHVRNSFDFFSRDVVDAAGGSFDSSAIEYTRETSNANPLQHEDLDEWNKWSSIISSVLLGSHLDRGLYYLSPYYRVSPYLVECERGLLSNSNWKDGEKSFRNGLNMLSANQLDDSSFPEYGRQT